MAHQRDAAVIPAAAAVNHDEGANGQGRGDENLYGIRSPLSQLLAKYMLLTAKGPVLHCFTVQFLNSESELRHVPLELTLSCTLELLHHHCRDEKLGLQEKLVNTTYAWATSERLQ